MRIEISLIRDNGTARSYTWPEEFIKKLSTQEIKDYAIHDVTELVKELLKLSTQSN